MLLTSQKCVGSIYLYFCLENFQCFGLFLDDSFLVVNVLIHAYFPYSSGLIFIQFFVFIKNLLKVSGNIFLNIAIISPFIS